MKESEFQASVANEIKQRLPGAIVLKTDCNYIQGFPDLLILFKNRWGALELKKETKAHKQPNQEYYVQLLGQMSFASFIFPENRKEVLDELEQALES